MKQEPASSAFDWYSALDRRRTALGGAWKSKWTRAWMRLMLVVLSTIVAVFGGMWITRQQALAAAQSPTHLTHPLPWQHPSIWDWTFGLTLVLVGVITAVWAFVRVCAFMDQNFEP